MRNVLVDIIRRRVKKVSRIWYKIKNQIKNYEIHLDPASPDPALFLSNPPPRHFHATEFDKLRLSSLAKKATFRKAVSKRRLYQNMGDWKSSNAR